MRYQQVFREGKFSVTADDARAATLVDWSTGGKAVIFLHSLIKENNRFEEILQCLKDGIVGDTVMMGAPFRLLVNGKVQVGDVNLDQEEFEAFKSVCDWNLKSDLLFDWTEAHKTMIVTQQGYLVKTLNFDMIEDEARASGLLTEDMVERIKFAGIARDQCRAFLNVLPKRGPDAVEMFLEVLLRTNQAHVFNYLLTTYTSTLFMKRYGIN